MPKSSLIAASPDVADLAHSWALTLEAENKAARTVAIYTESVRYLGAFLADRGMPSALAAITREHIEAYIADVLAHRKAATASIRYRSLRRFFEWCREEGEITESPMQHMRGPTIPEEPVPVISDDELTRLLRACQGTGFTERRDLALILFLLDTGVRRGECAGMTLTDLDLGAKVAFVVGKGRRPRAVAFGVRRHVPWTATYAGRATTIPPPARPCSGWANGALSADGIRQALERRGNAVGIAGLHAHRFRRTFAHTWLAGGGNEGDLMALTGWRSRQMLSRYAASGPSLN